MSARPGPISTPPWRSSPTWRSRSRKKIENIKATGSPELLKVEPIALAPRKADITIEQVVLAWTPWKTVAGAAARRRRISRGFQTHCIRLTSLHLQGGERKGANRLVRDATTTPPTPPSQGGKVAAPSNDAPL